MLHREHTDRKVLRLCVLLFCTILTAVFCINAASVSATSLSDAEKRQQFTAMYADYREDFPGIEEIDADKALRLLKDLDVIFVDVRKPEEQAVSMIPGAVTSEVFLADTERFRGQRIIAYCTISYRSGKLVAKLKRKGITMVNLKGGLLGWVHAGGPLVRGNLPVTVLHVYGRKWDLAPAGIETVY
ncbi:MAG: rhodanese-like domain-containing protein [Desulfobacteraceae bacterium]|nr:rhodanese-like domain-containing protein [Desulfobacteraceae bacterium]MBC2748982.1 rhodanese-like domain-containing protein [Desulfobacteraceae bacterium]